MKARADLSPFRNGMINVSPVGRNANFQERNDFEKWDKEHGARAKFVEALKEKFGDYGLTYADLLPKTLLVPPCFN